MTWRVENKMAKKKESGLVSYARKELQRAGLFDKNSDYDGILGDVVLRMVRQFSKEGHSGYSAFCAINLFRRVVQYMPLTSIEHPVEIDYIVVRDGRTDNKPVYQHCRLSSLFSEDYGKTWYDLDGKKTVLEKLFKRKGHVVKFPYLPE
jgi:hypothetical protein